MSAAAALAREQRIVRMWIEGEEVVISTADGTRLTAPFEIPAEVIDAAVLTWLEDEFDREDLDDAADFS